MDFFLGPSDFFEFKCLTDSFESRRRTGITTLGAGGQRGTAPRTMRELRVFRASADRARSAHRSISMSRYRALGVQHGEAARVETSLRAHRCRARAHRTAPVGTSPAQARACARFARFFTPLPVARRLSRRSRSVSVDAADEAEVPMLARARETACFSARRFSEELSRGVSRASVRCSRTRARRARVKQAQRRRLVGQAPGSIHATGRRARVSHGGFGRHSQSERYRSAFSPALTPLRRPVLERRLSFGPFSAQF